LVLVYPFRVSLERGSWDCVAISGTGLKNHSLERGSWDCVAISGTD